MAPKHLTNSNGHSHQNQHGIPSQQCISVPVLQKMVITEHVFLHYDSPQNHCIAPEGTGVEVYVVEL